MRPLGGLLALALLLAGCGRGASPDPQLTVFAAASLREVVTTLAAHYPDARLVIATGSSAALRTQIEQGAPADVFLSADTANPQALVDAGLTDGQAQAFATNRLVIITPADNPAAIMAAADLARPGVCVVGAGDEVPISGYALEAMARLGQADGYAANVCTHEDNVAAVVTKIELGEGDAAIVYASDAALAAERVTVVDLPSAADVVATYAGVAINGAGAAPGHAFLDWLRGAEAQSILADDGFGAAP